MSKLAFQETFPDESSASDDDEEGKNIDSPLISQSEDKYSSAKVEAAVGEEVPTSSQSKKKKKKKKKKTVTSSENSSGAIIEKKSSAGGSNQKSLSNSTLHGKSEHTTAKTVTPWLTKFLGSKRESGLVMPPEEFGVHSSEFIELFRDTYIKPSSSGSSALEDPDEPVSTDEADEEHNEIASLEESSEDDVFEVDKNGNRIVLSPERATSATPSVLLSADGAETKPSELSFRLFNLPYVVTEKQIEEFALKRGVRVLSCKLGDGKTKGQAVITAKLKDKELEKMQSTLPPASVNGDNSMAVSTAESAAIANALREEDCGGRNIRLVELSGAADKKRRTSGRYFVEGMNIKCNNCNQPGHKAAECPNPVNPPPCILCAGQDHEAVNCPNIMCFRCGLFGHHLRDCTNARMSRPVLCTICGSCAHETRTCPQTWVNAACLDAAINPRGGNKYSRGNSGVAEGVIEIKPQPFSKLDGAAAKCMRCNQFGHTCCGAMPGLADRTIYCPNCGESGHHVDLVLPGCRPQCCAPRFEAYNKFGTLMTDLDDPLHGSHKGRDQTPFYQRLVANQSSKASMGPNSYDALTFLFPSLGAAAPKLTLPMKFVTGVTHTNVGASTDKPRVSASSNAGTASNTTKITINVAGSGRTITLPEKKVLPAPVLTVPTPAPPILMPQLSTPKPQPTFVLHQPQLSVGVGVGVGASADGSAGGKRGRNVFIDNSSRDNHTGHQQHHHQQQHQEQHHHQQQQQQQQQIHHRPQHHQEQLHHQQQQQQQQQQIHHRPQHHQEQQRHHQQHRQYQEPEPLVVPYPTADHDRRGLYSQPQYVDTHHREPDYSHQNHPWTRPAMNSRPPPVLFPSRNATAQPPAKHRKYY